jgi:acyl dehydratase
MAQDEANITGRIYKSAEPFLITAEKMANFCASVGENNPLYVDPAAAKAGPYGEIVASPAFVASFRYADNLFDKVPVLNKRGLMAGIDLELGEPIRAGDLISAESQVKEIYEKTGRSGTMVFVVVRSTLTNQKGEFVAHVDHRMMRRL